MKKMACMSLLAFFFVIIPNGEVDAVDNNNDSVGNTKNRMYRYYLKDGPDICIKRVKEQLGEEAKIFNITSYFLTALHKSVSERGYPKGGMMTCSATYQDPENHKKLLAIKMDTRTGNFLPPRRVELKVPGDASKFHLEHYLTPISEIDASRLHDFMIKQDKILSARYAHYDWSRVRLIEPRGLKSKSVLRIDVEGRLDVNDIIDSGYAIIARDSKSVIDNKLVK